ncbi:methyltransferase domain-containing protein [Nocardioides sp.]|uniref:methyltransferase domain-containing protein n=1 Tax=Nocardioides sp. TaxID=35761 RepID=UPI002734E735|nr:methyltransferase domain-containing protein [Nocardioides sp.]MDP3893277.1 methyltransferase domain-containing protein [Nocardioides sp.]
MTTSLDPTDLEQRVVTMYTAVAEHPERDYHFETGRALAERLGYPVEDLDAIPPASLDSFAGVGYFGDLAAIRSGEMVVDLGSGSGTDSFVAARHTGADGRVIGIDMTPAQLVKAQRLADEDRWAYVDFRQGHIERLPLPDGIVDVLVSNGVINLAPDKAAVFAEAARVLRPGGRLALADIVTESPLPEGVVCDAALWAACIGGAMQEDAYREAIRSAGLRVEAVRPNDAYRFLSQSAVNATGRWGVKSISLLARKV